MSQNRTKCPNCQTIYSFIKPLGKDQDKAEVWSDGFHADNSGKDILRFSKCKKCDTFFWLKEYVVDIEDDITKISNIDNFWDINYISSLDIDFVKKALETDLASSRKKEIYLRMKLWHVINHVMRKHDSQDFFKKLFKSSEYKNAQKLYNANISLKMSNLVRLSNLLKLNKGQDADYLLIAEIYRELGDFNKALLFCHKAETVSMYVDEKRINLTKNHAKSKSKEPFKLG